MKSKIKFILRKIGLFPIIRQIYRQINIKHRKERVSNFEFYQKIVNEGDLCFDIGANLGQTVEALLKCKAKIVAVEPNPLCYPTLNYQFKNLENLTFLKVAIGSNPGISELNFSGTDATASIRNDWKFIKTDKKIPVKVITLDNIIEKYGCPRFLKVDVEGFELEVFKGLTKPIELIYFEIHGDEKELAIEVIKRLEEIGEIHGIKAISGDNSTWLIDQWCKPKEVINKLGEPIPKLANLIVKMKVMKES